MTTYNEIRDLALSFPGVEEGTSYGTPALKVRRKLMIRLREDGDTVVFRVGLDNREILLKARPEIFFITDHYRSYPFVLARLSTVEVSDVVDVIEMSWRRSAPFRLVESFLA